MSQAAVHDDDATKRLSFGELSQQLNGRLRVDAREVARVIEEGKGEPGAFAKYVLSLSLSFAPGGHRERGLRTRSLAHHPPPPLPPSPFRALEVLSQQCAERRDAIEGGAKEQCVSVGEADLRRMKRQFSSLKNTFLHYEVKDEFIAALADGLPNGTEEIQLQQFEEEAERTIAQLRDWKAKNVDKQGEIASLIAEVDSLMADVTGDSKRALGELRGAFEEITAFEATFDDSALDIEPGMDEEACQRVIEEESRRATELEGRLIASMEELRGLEERVPEGRHEDDLMREELRGLAEAVRAAETEKVHIEEAQRENTARTMKAMAEEGRKVAQQRARAKASVWAAESVLVLQGISGVSDVRLDGNVLKLTNEIMYPIKAMASTSSASEAVLRAHTASVVHAIELDMDAKTGLVVGGRVVPKVGGVTVAQAVEGIVRANRSATVERVLGELRTQLGAYHHRVAVIEGEVRPRCGAVESVSSDARSFVCEVGEAGEAGGSGVVQVGFKMTGCWPEEDDRFEAEGAVGGDFVSVAGESTLAELRSVGFDV